MTDKQQLRQQALARRRVPDGTARALASAAIRLRLRELLTQDERLADAPLLSYRSMGDEVDTTCLFEAGMAGHAIFAPVTHHAGEMIWRRVHTDTRWQRGDFGVLEPASGSLWAPDDKPSVLLCPLVGFDRCGNRLGMGKGCFDRWLGEMKDHILLGIGLAFACQEFPQIPTEAHDMPLHIIITEGETITCRNC